MYKNKILIVEDELIAAANIARYLQKEGYQVIAKVNSGEKALEQVDREIPDLVLMDIMLRGKLDGIETASRIRQRYRMPIVYITAYADRATLDRAKETEPYGYLVKPFKSQDISTTIEMALQKRKGEKKIEDRLDTVTQLNQLKSETLAIASHDLRTPLSTILCSTELLKNYSDKLSSDKQKKHLDRIKFSVNNMTDLLEDLLVTNQLEADRITCNLDSIDLVSFCQRLIEQLQPLSKKHRLDLVFTKPLPDLGGKLPQLDNRLLRQILTNLLSNAIKYSPDGGKVLLQVTLEAQQVTFEIQDWGIGIPAEFQEKLFRQFERGTNVGAVQGTGLGLYIVKQAVTRHCGTISLESQEALGTTFTVTLPSAVSRVEIDPIEKDDPSCVTCH
ncbi:response regulator [Oscillatoriales cyanobacterium LEGE 11467]|uniref:histidine kinase n=1 Tax=Zarconia navalis LEGE 11467 TaxID=1828826 RepID=A0A928VWW1_9CYAN|nr:ATP-binding protein [Zarconia navalis]MBE9039643.1 response regulator [Zarconia navalis LEGE 11467]